MQKVLMVGKIGPSFQTPSHDFVRTWDITFIRFDGKIAPRRIDCAMDTNRSHPFAHGSK